MRKNNETLGDKDKFIRSWQERCEKFYNHWTKKKPKNQIQLAFKNHWEVFQGILNDRLFNKGKRCLEVGCGRGNMSAYFSNVGYDCTLLDISPEVIKIAEALFKKNNLKARFKVGDVNNLPFNNNSFDIIFSIGLLEHFQEIERPIKEQIRVLEKGGIFMGYVVPEYKENIQKDYEWINKILEGYVKNRKRKSDKERLFRSTLLSKSYIKAMKKYGLRGIKSSGIYSLPMISHSVEFPFSLMPEKSEEVVVDYFQKILSRRRKESKKHPWLCREGHGQAFLIWGFK